MKQWFAGARALALVGMAAAAGVLPALAQAQEDDSDSGHLVRPHLWRASVRSGQPGDRSAGRKREALSGGGRYLGEQASPGASDGNGACQAERSRSWRHSRLRWLKPWLM